VSWRHRARASLFSWIMLSETSVLMIVSSRSSPWCYGEMVRCDPRPEVALCMSVTGQRWAHTIPGC
jgi:hypothetical protein